MNLTAYNAAEEAKDIEAYSANGDAANIVGGGGSYSTFNLRVYYIL